MGSINAPGGGNGDSERPSEKPSKRPIGSLLANGGLMSSLRDFTFGKKAHTAQPTTSQAQASNPSLDTTQLAPTEHIPSHISLVPPAAPNTPQVVIPKSKDPSFRVNPDADLTIPMNGPSKKSRLAILAGVLAFTAAAALAVVGSKGGSKAPTSASDAGVDATTLAVALESEAGTDSSDGATLSQEIDIDNQDGGATNHSDNKASSTPAAPDAKAETFTPSGNFTVKAGSGVGKQIFDAALSLAKTAEQRTQILALETKFEAGATKDIDWSINNPKGQDSGKMAYYKRLLRGSHPKATVEANDPDLAYYQTVESDFSTNGVSNIHNIQAGKELNDVRLIKDLSKIVGADINTASANTHSDHVSSAVQHKSPKIDFKALDQAFTQAHAKQAPTPFKPIFSLRSMPNLPTTAGVHQHGPTGLDTLTHDYKPSVTPEEPVTTSTHDSSHHKKAGHETTLPSGPKVIRNAPIKDQLPSTVKPDAGSPVEAPKPTGRFERLMHDGQIRLPSHWDIEKAFEPEFFGELQEVIENCGIMGCKSADEQEAFSKFIKTLSPKDLEVIADPQDDTKMIAILRPAKIAQLKTSLESAKTLADLDSSWD